MSIKKKRIHLAPHLTKDQLNEIGRLYLDNELSLSEIGRMFKKSDAGIRIAVKKMGLSRNFDRRAYSVNDNKFSEEWTREHSYWLGLLHADGYVGKNGTVFLELKTADGYLVDQFAEFIGFTGEIKSLPPHEFVSTNGKTYTSSGTRRLSFSSKAMAADLVRMGIVARAKAIHPVPVGYSDYLRGMFDGNGSILRRKKLGSWEWCYTGHEPAISEFCKVADLLGVSYSIRKFPGHMYMSIKSSSGAIGMMQWLHKDDPSVFMDRKAIVSFREDMWSESGRSIPRSFCTEWEPSKRRWRVRITVDGKSIGLGRYKTKGQAWVAYAKDSLRRHGKRSPFYRIG